MYLVCAIFKTTAETADYKFLKLDFTGLISMTTIMMMVANTILHDAKDKIIIILESQSMVLIILSFLGYFANILTLGIIFLHLGIEGLTIN